MIANNTWKRSTGREAPQRVAPKCFRKCTFFRKMLAEPIDVLAIRTRRRQGELFAVTKRVVHCKGFSNQRRINVAVSKNVMKCPDKCPFAIRNAKQVPSRQRSYLKIESPFTVLLKEFVDSALAFRRWQLS